MLLSTIVMHHHHYGQVCIAIEQCAADGNVNDAHTHHPSGEQDGCRVHQMHHFIVASHTVQSLCRHAADATHYSPAMLPSARLLAAATGRVGTPWRAAAALSQRAAAVMSRRGPPAFCL